MKNINCFLSYIIACVYFFLASFSVLGQSASVSSGKTILSDSGSVSISVGQSVFTYFSNDSGSITQGVQQSIIIEELNNIENTKNDNTISVYPNPTNNEVYVRLFTNHSYNYELLDVSSKLLIVGKLHTDFSRIDLLNYPSGVYFLKLRNMEKQTIRTYKIIKK